MKSSAYVAASVAELLLTPFFISQVPLAHLNELS